MRQTRSIMAMPVVLEIVGSAADETIFEDIFSYFTEIDARFSTYKVESEIQCINRGEISEEQYSEDMRTVLALAEETSLQTMGSFSIHTPAGTIDPSGIVKGWSIQQAALKLRKRGVENFYLEIAGDIQSSGMNSEGGEWSVGVRNPFVHEEIIKVLYPKGKGIATSGTAARGDHLYDPHAPEGRVHTPYVSLTIIGPDVCEADRFATAAFVMGERGLFFIENLPGFEAYAVHTDHTARMTSGFERYTQA
jgi:thiamine biosynthesis lipoprotein